MLVFRKFTKLLFILKRLKFDKIVLEIRFFFRLSGLGFRTLFLHILQLHLIGRNVLITLDLF